MSNFDDFSDFNDDDYGFDSTTLDEPTPLDETDEFDQLRRTSARSETMFNDLSEDDFIEERDSSGGGFSMSNFSPGQRLILAVLVILDILIVGFGLLVILGVI